MSIDGDGRGIVDLDGVRHQACLDLLPETRIGDYVIVHAGFAISVLDPEEAEATLALFRELNEINSPFRADPPPS
jgi:hydrogenase expression/formation protein HypC